MSDVKKMVVYSIRESKDGQSKWVKLGVAFENRDGSLNVYLDALPIDGKLHIRSDEKGTS